MTERFFILSQRKLTNSRDGNPRYKFVAVDSEGKKHLMHTAVDAGWVYAITDWTHKMIVAKVRQNTRNTIVFNATVSENF